MEAFDQGRVVVLEADLVGEAVSEFRKRVGPPPPAQDPRSAQPTKRRHAPS